MGEVQHVWLVRKVRSALLVRVAAMGVVAIVGGFYISYGAIFANVAHASSFTFYVVDAIAKTELAVQALLFLAGVLGALLLWDVGRFIGLLFTRFALGRQSNLARAHEFYK